MAPPPEGSDTAGIRLLCPRDGAPARPSPCPFECAPPRPSLPPPETAPPCAISFGFPLFVRSSTVNSTCHANGKKPSPLTSAWLFAVYSYFSLETKLLSG